MALSKRLTADPTIGVNDLMKPFLAWFKESGKYDLASMLTPKSHVSWKTAPDIDWLADLHPLFMKLLKVAKASILPSQKLKSALEKIQREVCRINFSKNADDQFFDMMDNVRIAASQLRTLKKETLAYARSVKKASIQQKEKLDDMLSLIQFPQDEVETGLLVGVSSTSPPTMATSVVAVSDKAASVNEGVEVKLSIFKKILQKRPSDENAMPAAVDRPSSASSSKEPSGCRIKGRLTFDLSVDDKELLATALGSEPTPSKDLEKPKKRRRKEGPELAKLSFHMMEECSLQNIVGVLHSIISFWSLPGDKKKKARQETKKDVQRPFT